MCFNLKNYSFPKNKKNDNEINVLINFWYQHYKIKLFFYLYHWFETYPRITLIWTFTRRSYLQKYILWNLRSNNWYRFSINCNGFLDNMNHNLSTRNICIWIIALHIRIFILYLFYRCKQTKVIVFRNNLDKQNTVIKSSVCNFSFVAKNC